ncbi:hypothetical protein RDWZM_003306 [Blomia tropicalis]|uniref:receptor protein-tyrosine kinase n=1 Tax=Blomia tropicalis TaxID=40697 RepID=A0A9Q0MF08_BLOTA|nr:hypothetical protein RDWZM_003306 [Blomia tropicalis]
MNALTSYHLIPLFYIWFAFILLSTSTGEELPTIIVGPKTLITLAGENITLSCATAPNNDSALLISWQRNGQSISLSKHRQTLVHHPENGSISTLHLDHVSELDEGVYQCTARNEIGLDISRPARLTVQYAAKITGGQRFVYNVTVGTKVPIECNARGQPPPKLELLVENDSLLDKDKDHFSNVFIQFNATKNTNITCRASNFLVPLNHSVEDTKIYEIYVQQIDEPIAELESIELDVEEQEKSKTPNGYCAPYLGQICRNHVPKNSLVFYNLSDADDFAANINEEIVSSLWSELIVSLLEPCRSAAEKLLCYYAFPQCEWSKGFPQSKPLCQEDCIAVRESFCNREWAMLEDNRQRGVYFKSRGHFRLPDCDQLPLHSNRSSSDSCSHAELTTFRKSDATYDCIKGRGRFYQGTINVTKHGIACQRWDQQSPHAHNRPPFVFPEIWNSENYCRNAGGEEPMPWCYTQDPFIRWQHCDIAVCDSDKVVSNVSEKASTTIKSIPLLVYEYFLTLVRQPLSTIIQPDHPLALPMGAALLSLVLIIICLILAFSVRAIFRRQHLYTQTMTSIAGISDDLDLSKLPSNCAYHCTSVHLNPKLEALEYPRNKIVYVRDIGCGAFGRVFMAKAPGLIPTEETTIVAVKVLRDEATEDMQSDFEREATLMAEFDHKNVVKLLGVCAIVRLPNADDTFIEHPKKLSQADLVNLARQIAAGMVYLSGKRFVHRDLSARNCLVNDQMEVKISDFGLSQRITSINYYRADIEKDAVPIRWMPLESILFGRFTTASDVWAFGVLLWEIFSFSLQPYYGLSHEQVINYLKDGNLLAAPESCLPSVYALMRSCWQAEASARPSFQALENSLNDLYAILTNECANSNDTLSTAANESLLDV